MSARDASTRIWMVPICVSIFCIYLVFLKIKTIKQSTAIVEFIMRNDTCPVLAAVGLLYINLYCFCLHIPLPYSLH